MSTFDKRTDDVIRRNAYSMKEVLHDSQDLFEDLGMDSLDHVELVMDIEREFDIDVTNEQALEWHTVGDVRRFVRVHV